MSNKITVYVVRHGETEWNTKKIIQGHKDSPLTELGVNQAKELAKQFKKIKFDLVFSSDLLRAKKTAEIIAAEHNLAVETTKLLRERAFGHLEGQPIMALKAFEEVIEKLSGDKFYTYKSSPDIESNGEIVERIITFLREAAIAHAGKKILVITHGGIIRTFLVKLGVLAYRDAVWIGNGDYVKLETDGSDFEVKEIKGMERRNGKRVY